MEFCYVTIDNNVTDRHLLTSCECQRLPPAPPMPPLLPDPETDPVAGATYYWLIGLFLALAVIAGGTAIGLYYMKRKKIGFWKPNETENVKGSKTSDSHQILLPTASTTNDNTSVSEGGNELERSPTTVTSKDIVIDANSTTGAPEEHNAGNLASAGDDPNQSLGTLGAAGVVQNQSSGSAGNDESQRDGSSAQSRQDDGTVQIIPQSGSSAYVRSQPSLDNVNSSGSMTPVENA